MKQYRITSENISTDSPDDCYLSHDDPIHELKAASALGGLGAAERLIAYRSTLQQPVVSSDKGRLQRELGIKPGTPAWFELWFGKNNK